MFSNIWNHPKTSVTGLSLAVLTIAGVLSQQGITLGNAGTGTVVTLIAGLATALLGLVSRDPGDSSPSSGSTAKLGAWALIALLLPLPFMTGCNGVTVAQDIVNWTPALQSAVATVNTTASLLAPADAPIFTAATVGFDAASNLLVAQAKVYLANPSAPVLAQLQSQIVVLQQQVNTALLQVAKISNSQSQQHALAAVQGVGTIVSTILALVQSVSSKAAVAQMAAASTVKLASVRPYLLNDQTTQIIAAHYDVSTSEATLMTMEGEYDLEHAGF